MTRELIGATFPFGLEIGAILRVRFGVSNCANPLNDNNIKNKKAKVAFINFSLSGKSIQFLFK